MTIILRPKRILFIIVLFFSTIEALYSIPNPSWYIGYYERATWDGKKWIYRPTPNDVELVLEHYFGWKF